MYKKYFMKSRAIIEKYAFLLVLISFLFLFSGATFKTAQLNTSTKSGEKEWVQPKPIAEQSEETKWVQPKPIAKQPEETKWVQPKPISELPKEKTKGGTTKIILVFLVLIILAVISLFLCKKCCPKCKTDKKE